jgi:hypothetical protein
VRSPAGAARQGRKLIRVLKATLKGPRRGSQRPTKTRPHTGQGATTSAGDQARFSPQNGPPTGRPATKTSKLVTVFAGDWAQLLCNGCYGWLLSVYNVKAQADDAGSKAEVLAAGLLRLVPVDAARRCEELVVLREGRARTLQPRSLRLLATSTFVATQLEGTTSLDWSAAVIGFCKAVEVELLARLVEPLRTAAQGSDLQVDVDDKDLGRVARYCSGRSATPPEIGAIRHFLHTAASSRRRQASSPLIGRLRTVVQRWPNSDWLFDVDGGLKAMAELTTRFRNRAAHTDELTPEDYSAGFELVAGPDGILWSLVWATTQKAGIPKTAFRSLRVLLPQ